ncbi:hypothetical protein CROQUDRAFT_394611 [Cronartium quercuum f. sp. fusiforme G11]|uniref:Uncharacterized protein n=1 Tax=Cronartium quercuum f. sp. fusiforme G11 TaxID=708437 RepID=A0A9P6TDS0_9BASI|nr:hypothetical protein CROQUDRAFT_394611 [Cronartium quercuum f. sp. fusiforme G11]
MISSCLYLSSLLSLSSLVVQVILSFLSSKSLVQTLYRFCVFVSQSSYEVSISLLTTSVRHQSRSVKLIIDTPFTFNFYITPCSRIFRLSNCS